MLWLVILIVLMIPLLAVVLDSQLVRALSARIESDGRTTADPALAKRLAQLEGEVERLNHEVLRLDEETTFLHRLLEKKPYRLSSRRVNTPTNPPAVAPRTAGGSARLVGAGILLSRISGLVREAVFARYFATS